MLPVCFIPCASMESPAAAKTVTPASTRYLRRLTRNSLGGGTYSGLDWIRCCGRGLVAMPLDHLVTHGTYLEETFGFLVQTLAVVAVKRSFLQDAEHSLGPEIIFVVETMHRAENIVRRQSRILDVRQLVAAIVDHLLILHHEPVADRLVVQFRTRIGMRDRNLDGLNIQFLGKSNGVVDGFVSLARQPHDEVPMY